MFRRLAPLGVIAVMIGGLTTNATTTAAPIILDDFSQNPGSWSNGTPAGTLQNSPPRNLSIDKDLSGGDFIEVNTTKQTFESTRGVGKDYALTLGYTVNGSFTGSNQIILDFASLDLPMDVQLVVHTTSGPLQATYTIPTTGPGNPFTFFLPFSSLTGGSLSWLSNTTGIDIIFNYNNKTDIDFLLRGDTGGIKLNGNIPEPATLASFGLMGLVGGLVLRRKLRHRQLANA